jgi:hypothetical protein
MNDIERLELAIEALKSMSTRTVGRGICTHFTEYDSWLNKSILHPYFETWPKFSGNIAYPVPAGDGDTHGPVWAYQFTSEYNMWNKKCSYGRNRHALLAHCITEATEELSSLKYKVSIHES